MPIKRQEEEEYEVEAILDVKKGPKSLLYLVKWKGFGHEDNTWEPKGNLDPNVIKQFDLMKEIMTNSSSTTTTAQQADTNNHDSLVPLMFGSNSLSSLLQNKKLERDYIKAISDINEGQKALFMSSMLPPTSQNLPEIGSNIKEWAVGSFMKYDDRPFQIQGVRESPGDQRLYLVDWKIRGDGFKPIRCYVPESEIEQADKDMLIAYLARHIHFLTL